MTTDYSEKYSALFSTRDVRRRAWHAWDSRFAKIWQAIHRVSYLACVFRERKASPRCVYRLCRYWSRRTKLTIPELLGIMEDDVLASRPVVYSRRFRQPATL